MEELWVGIIGATLTLSVLTGLMVQWAKGSFIEDFVADVRYQKLAANVLAMVFGLAWSYLGAFILGETGGPELIARAGAQGVIAALAATYGYETLKNGAAAFRA